MQLAQPLTQHPRWADDRAAEQVAEIVGNVFVGHGRERGLTVQRRGPFILLHYQDALVVVVDAFPHEPPHADITLGGFL